LITAYDVKLARRALAIAALSACVALVVIVATDEGGDLARRAALVAALSPALGGIGALAAARIASSRGETRALEALGASPDRALLGALVGGMIVAAMGPLLVLSSIADLEPLFPRPSEPSAWVAAPGGGMRDAVRGTLLGPSGALVVVPSRVGPSVSAPPPERRVAVGLALVILALGAPLSAIERGSRTARAALVALVVFAMIAAFQLAAARRASSFVVCVPPIVLLAVALASRYRGTTSRWAS